MGASPDRREGDVSADKPAAAKGDSSVLLGAVVGLVILAGAAGGAYKFFGEPSLSSTPCGRGTLALIGSLKSSVTVTLYVTVGTRKLDRFASDVTASMRDLEKASNGKLVYKLALVTTPDLATEAKEAGLQEQAFPDDSEGKDPRATGIQRGFCGMVLTYGSEKEAIPYLDPTLPRSLPFWVAGKIRELRARGDDVASRFGIVSGKGGVSLAEPSLVARQAGGAGGPNMKGVFAQALPFYKLEDLDLRGGEAEIDSSYSGVIVLQPAADFTDKELRRIDEFLMRGKKSVVVIASAVNVKPSDASMTADIGAHGLDRLLGGYGIEMAGDVVQDVGHEGEASFSTATGTPIHLRLPGMLLVKPDTGAAPDAQTLDTTFVPFFRLEEVVFPFASTLLLHPEKQPTARLHAVARSSAMAMSSAGPTVILNPMRAEVPKGAGAQRILAAALEGKIKSAFAGRPGDGLSAPEVAAEDSRLLVLSASQFTVNPLARAANPAPGSPTDIALGAAPSVNEDLAILSQPYAQRYLTTTILALKNTFDWASADDATVACSALLLNEGQGARGK